MYAGLGARHSTEDFQGYSHVSPREDGPLLYAGLGARHSTEGFQGYSHVSPQEDGPNNPTGLGARHSTESSQGLPRYTPRLTPIHHVSPREDGPASGAGLGVRHYTRAPRVSQGIAKSRPREDGLAPKSCRPRGETNHLACKNGQPMDVPVSP